MFRIGLLIVLVSSAFGERRIVVENEFVRVLDVTESGTVKGRPHEHPMNRVMIYLTPGKQQLEYAGGEKRVLEFQAGTPLWSAAGGVHTSQNLGAPFRVIEVKQQVPMHEHGPNRVVVFLTDAHLRVIDDSGVSNELKVEAGTVRWSGSARHREENLSSAPFEVIAVELK